MKYPVLIATVPPVVQNCASFTFKTIGGVLLLYLQNCLNAESLGAGIAVFTNVVAEYDIPFSKTNVSPD